ncbi:CRISPR-associated endonuclease Cas1 [Saccharopolyspora phatthalungensis]|uniref:CRISPR-associated protein Cas1 n=1 Tax=Saccharopolyspora phatthalungensis TaxID=664693 RepID=A0A840Q4V9_9PSEU|nr:CRISPR-associated endonuclease Cas1 [Saccharopolyspora phatthalungensis]MBB5155604.1 CRISPR-associated protein Cas1 [Saccharopolyspora phatthalungensis]
MTEPITETFTRESRDPSVVVVDGHGISITVKKGELVIKDGMCGRGRTRTIARKDRHVRRIVVIGQTGHISIDAMSWIHGLGVTPGGKRRTDPISLVVISPEGELMNASAQSMADTRVLRAQACARSVGLKITKHLLAEKVQGHRQVIPEWDAATWIDRLNACTSQRQCRTVEAEEARAYFDSWRLLELQFDGQVPYHWRIFDSRTSELNHNANAKQNANRNAINPVNAMLNYCYEIAKAETVLACYVQGVDPNMGVCHSDTYMRSMALDIVEVARPLVESYVTHLIANRTFKPTDFVEKDTGVVRVLRPLTSELSEQRLIWHRAVAEHVEHVRKLINGTVKGWKRADSTRLTGTNQREGWLNGVGVA